MGAFPSTRKASVVWAGVDDAARGLAAVAAAGPKHVGQRFGFARERREFTGHVTIPLFAHLSSRQLRRIASSTNEDIYKAGDVIINEGGRSHRCS